MDTHWTKTHRRDGALEIDQHDTLEDAQAFALEEVMWETTRRVDVSDGYRVIDTHHGTFA